MWYKKRQEKRRRKKDVVFSTNPFLWKLDWDEGADDGKRVKKIIAF